MKTTLEQAEKIVGRKLCKVEKQIFALSQDDDRYEFYKDGNGNLGSRMIETPIKK